ncbi:hypothetical protein [Xanthobacter sp. KR7-225]|uniref:hypothetical protein n=1 Tax=Xanthobacter sp. KR7-225 TaxID=3156613 RepID=UPI0032B5DD17
MSTIVWGLLGAVSGLVSGIVPDFGFGLPQDAGGLVIHTGGVTLFTPLAFALVLVIGLAPGGLAPVKGALVFLATVAGWVLAINVWLQIGNFLDSEGGGLRPELVRALAGGAAGLVGAALTFAGASRARPALRRAGSAARVILAGTVAGMLFQDWIIIEPLSAGAQTTLVGPGIEVSQFILLYVLWQAAVAAAIGHALNRRA